MPVKLYTASRDRKVRFHWLHDEDGARIRNKRICPKDGEDVSKDDIVKGYEVASDQYVLVTDEELEALEPESSKTIDLEQFVDQSEIDAVHFDRPYYLVPGETAGRAYRLLIEAMESEGKVAVARIVMRRKEHLVSIRPTRDVLVMETMRYADELVPPQEVFEGVEITEEDPPAKEVEMAQKLVETLSGEFDPSEYEDRYRKRVLEFIQKKAEGEEVVVEPKAEARPATQDVLTALEESLRKAEKDIEAEA